MVQTVWICNEFVFLKHAVAGNDFFSFFKYGRWQRSLQGFPSRGATRNSVSSDKMSHWTPPTCYRITVEYHLNIPSTSGSY